MQKHFYILPSSDIVSIKDTFNNISEKLKLWRHKLKDKLQIQSDDTPAIVRERAGQILQKYKLEDVDKLLAKWYDVSNQVGQYFNCNHVVLLIVSV
jgi:hypothetical protein